MYEPVKCRVCGTITSAIRCPNCGERAAGCQPFDQWPEIMTPADVMNYVGLAQHETYRMFSRKDFPLINKGVQRGKKIGKYALRDYLNRGVVLK